MLKWTEGPRTRGCAYHQKAKYQSPFLMLQVDVFVMPRIARSRPIAITLHVTTRKAGYKRMRGSITKPREAASLAGRLVPKLVALSVGDERSAAIAADIAKLIERDADQIRQALGAHAQ